MRYKQKKELSGASKIWEGRSKGRRGERGKSSRVRVREIRKREEDRGRRREWKGDQKNMLVREMRE